MAELSEPRRIAPKNHDNKTAVNKGNPINRASSSCRTPLNKHKLEAILENIPSAVVVFEKPDGKVTYANQRAVELHGVDPCGISLEQHAKALKIFSMNGKPCPTEELYTYRALFKEETVRDEPVIIERPDGRRFIINVNAKPLYDQNGKANGAIAIYEDVTERMQTQEALLDSEERLNMAQRIAHLGSWEYFVKEDRAVWSEELFQIFGLPQQISGPNFNDYLKHVHPEDRPLVEKRMRGGLPDSGSFDYRIIRQNGTVRTLHSERIVREYDASGRPSRVMGVEQDITERKRIEDKLEKYAKNLEHLVEERTRQLQNAERLAAIGQTASMIGHDIRNPLQAIAGDLYLMKQDIDSSPDSQCKQNVQESLVSIQEQIDYMNKIIADLQDFSRTLKPEPVEVDLCTLIPQLVNTVYIPYNIEARAECSRKLPKVKLDVTFLKRILVNLTTNSVQAMPNGGKLTIKTTQEGSTVVISVLDTGIGIPDDVKPKIFQPLMTTKSKGQGFGLAVVKRLVEAMGGTITFASQVGVGTEFKLTFPIQPK
ncbi:MAG: PAS domain-containing sensor histidine kinase [Candidatus Bathyarchaeia archaeon]|jgi:PAS domain S-box-containing protein